MKFDMSRAWEEATRLLSANRELALALAGVFLLVPHLALSLFFPPPEAAPGMTPVAMMGQMRAYYLDAAPFLIAVAVIQSVGWMAILTLFTDRSRPTVADAIRLGATAMLTYIGAQLLLGIAFGLIGGVLLGFAAAMGAQTLTALVVTALIAAMIYIGMRLIVMAPVIAVERISNPIEALRRSWDLTRGNAGQIVLFVLLLVLVGGVIMASSAALIGLLATMLAGAVTGKLVVTVLSSTLIALFTLVFIAVFAAMHRQLAGPSTGAISDTFS